MLNENAHVHKAKPALLWQCVPVVQYLMIIPHVPILCVTLVLISLSFLF